MYLESFVKLRQHLSICLASGYSSTLNSGMYLYTIYNSREITTTMYEKFVVFA